MKKISQLLIRVLIVAAAVVLATALVYFLTGGRTSRGLSDWLVYASFLTLAAGTLAGISRAGYPGGDADGPAAGESGLQRLVHAFFRSGSLGISVTLAGIVCFGVAILVDGLF